MEKEMEREKEQSEAEAGKKVWKCVFGLSFLLTRHRACLT